MMKKFLLAAMAILVALSAPASAFTPKDFTEVELRSMALLCNSKWEFNERMQQHCIENQARAVFWMKNEFTSWGLELIRNYASGLTVDFNALGDRVEEFTLSCAKKWHKGDEVYDFAMIKFCLQRSFEEWLSAKKVQGRL